MHTVSRAGTALLIPFIASMILSGEVIGSFCRSLTASSFALYSDANNRVAHVAGAFLLVLAGLSFAWLAYLLSCRAGSHQAALLIAGAAGRSHRHDCGRAGLGDRAAEHCLLEQSSVIPPSIPVMG